VYKFDIAAQRIALSTHTELTFQLQV